MPLTQILSAGLVALLGLIAGCATNPVTGRQDFVLMSEEQELALGQQTSEEVSHEYPAYDDARLQGYVQRVGEQLVVISHRPDLDYRFIVVDSKEVNAFALPGGHVYITRGLLAYLNSEAELAAVLGHEIGHVTARHSVRQYSAAQAASIGVALGSIFLPELGLAGADQLVSLFGTALLRGYGRDQELEADRLGAEYLARAGYEPTAMLTVLETLKNQEVFDTQLAKEEGREPRAYHGVFSTHPSGDTRLQEVVGVANELRTGAPARVEREEFLRMSDGLIVGDGAQEGVLRNGEFLHAGLGFGIRFPPGWQVENRPDRVTATAPERAAVLQLAVDDLKKPMSPREFLTEQLSLTELQAEGPISPAGLEGYSAVADVSTDSGREQVRINVIFLGDKAYLLAGLVRDRSNTGYYDTLFMQTTDSFHPLTAAERAASRPLRIALLQVGPDSTFPGLAAESPLTHHAEAQLRLLNGRYPDGNLLPGETIKVVY